MNNVEKLRLKNSVFLRYLLSFCIVFCLPVLLYQFVVYPHMLTILSNNEISIETEHMSVISENLRSRFTSLYEYSNSFYASSDIVSYVIHEDDPVNRMRIINELKSNFMSIGYDRAYYYNTHSNRLYTSTHSYKDEWLNRDRGNLLFVEDYPENQLYDILKSADRLTLFSSERVYLSGIRHNSTLLFLPTHGNYGVLLFVLDTDKLLQMSNGTDTTRLLIDAEDEILAVSTGIKDSQPDYADIVRMAETLSNKEGRVISNNKVEYVVTCNTLPEFEMRLLSITPLDSLYASINSIHRWYCVMLGIITLISVLLIFILSKRLYKPISTVKQRVSEANPNENFGNDWEVILEAINSMDNEKRQANLRYQALASNSQQYFLFRYLYDGLNSEQEILDGASLYGIDIREQVLCVAFSIVDHTQYNDISRRLISDLQQVNQQNPSAASCYIINGFNFVTFFAVLFFDNEEELKSYYYRFYHLPEGVKAGIGTYQHILEAGRSRSMAVAALDVALVSKDVNITNVDDIGYHEMDFTRKLFDQLQNLELAILRNNAEQVEEIFRTLMAMIFEKSNQYSLTANAYMNIYNTCVRNFNTLRNRSALSYAPMEYLYIGFGAPPSINEMRLNLETLKNQILSILESHPGEFDVNENQDRVREALLYIDEHHTDPSLSLTSISEHFGLSYSNFSHWIRSHTGTTFSSYLDKLRVEHGKELLRTSSLTVDQVAVAIGYTNAGTFTRTFKKYVNMSPGSYRKSADASLGNE